MAAIAAPPPAPRRGHHGPRAAAGVLAARFLLTWRRRRCRPAAHHLGLHALQLLLEVVDEQQKPLHHVVVPIDCVPGHAALRIGAHPRGSASRRSQGIRLAPRGPPRAEVLRAWPGVTPGRAYGSIGHRRDERRRRSRCLRRCPGAAPPGWRLRFLLSHSGRAAPRAVAATWARVGGLADAGALLPVVRLLLVLVADIIFLPLEMCTLGGVELGVPLVHLLPHGGAHLVPHLASEFWRPRLPHRSPPRWVPRHGAEGVVLGRPLRRPQAWG